MSPPLLEARGITRKKPDGGLLLESVDLALHPGERVSLVGASGAGKSLLLRALALLDPLDAGDVLWRGRTIANLAVPGFRADVIYLHQRPALFEGSVEDNLRLPLTLAMHAGKTFDRDRILSWLAALGRDGDFLGKPGRDLSGGETQIVALLRALQLDPMVLLFDEATSALDRETADRAEQLIAAWQTADRAALWVSHDPAQASRGDRTVVIERGRI